MASHNPLRQSIVGVDQSESRSVWDPFASRY